MFQLSRRVAGQMSYVDLGTTGKLAHINFKWVCPSAGRPVPTQASQGWVQDTANLPQPEGAHLL